MSATETTITNPNAETIQKNTSDARGRRPRGSVKASHTRVIPLRAKGTARRLTLTALSGCLALGVVAGTQAAPAQADGIQLANSGWIKQTGLEVRGTYANLAWQSNASTTNLQISTSPPKHSAGKWTFDGPYSGSTVPKVNGSFKYMASGLNPATTYHLILTTPATPTLTSTQVTGSFTTKTRSFSVTFQKIHVSDDADGFGRGAGDLTWYFHTNLTGWSNKGWYREASSGDTINVDYNGNGALTHGAFTVTAPSVTLTVQGVDDDGVGFCPMEWAIGMEPKQESTKCDDFAFAQTAWTFPTGLFEQTEMSWEASVSGNPALEFTVYGTIQATYS